MNRRNDTIYLSILTVIILVWAMAWLRTVDARPCGPDKPGLDECAFIVKPTATQVYIAPPPTTTPTPTATPTARPSVQSGSSKVKGDEGQTFVGPTPGPSPTGDGRQQHDGIPTQVHQPPTATAPIPEPYPAPATPTAPAGYP